MATRPYTIVRDTEFYDRLFWTYYRLSIQSNLILAAKYEGIKQVLSKELLIEALRIVLEAQPRLRQVLVPEQRGKKLWLQVAVLNEIDLEKCIEVIKDDGRGITDDLLERYHNQWPDWAEDHPSAPSWKVILKGQHILFVYSHTIGDGKSSYVFHRELLTALNSIQHLSADTRSTVVPTDPSVVKVGSIATAPLLIMPKPSIRALLWRALLYFLCNLFYGKKRFNATRRAAKLYHKDFSTPCPPDLRANTGVVTRRISAEDVGAIMGVGRQHGVKLTSMLSIMYIATLALEHYPTAVMATPVIAVDIRDTLDMDLFSEGSSPAGNGVMMNAAATTQRPLFVKTLRGLFSGEKGQVKDKEAFWAYARAYQADMRRRMKEESPGSFRAPQLLGDTLDDLLFKALPRFDTYHTSLLSNLGAFEAGRGQREKEDWQVSDVVFSVGATNGNIGSHGVILSVAGTKGGDLVIVGNYEKSVVEREEAEGLLDGIVRRLYNVTGVAKV